MQEAMHKTEIRLYTPCSSAFNIAGVAIVTSPQFAPELPADSEWTPIDWTIITNMEFPLK